ncbi:MAG: hypothetical protein H7840_11680 [Alphaproteobacteria bacterium]
MKTHAADFFTDADIHAELQLTRRLTELLPGSVAVGEGGAGDPRPPVRRGAG